MGAKYFISDSGPSIWSVLTEMLNEEGRKVENTSDVKIYSQEEIELYTQGKM